MNVEKQFALGTVQLGMPYGIKNARQPTRDEAFEILDLCFKNNITFLDTARAYGDSEKIIGQYLGQKKINRADFTITTKLTPLNNSSEASASIETSLENLNLDLIDYFVFHRWSDRKNSEVFATVSKYKKHFKTLGASALNVKEACEILKDPAMTFIQLPMNLIDWRFYHEDFVTAIQARPDVHIQTRSILLQGVLADDFSKDSVAGVSLRPILTLIDEFKTDYKMHDRIALSYAYLKSIPQINSLVFGVDNIQQLRQNLEYIKVKSLTEKQSHLIRDTFTKLIVPEVLLNPYQWSQAQ